MGRSRSSPGAAGGVGREVVRLLHDAGRAAWWPRTSNPAVADLETDDGRIVAVAGRRRARRDGRRRGGQRPSIASGARHPRQQRRPLPHEGHPRHERRGVGRPAHDDERARRLRALPRRAARTRRARRVRDREHGVDLGAHRPPAAGGLLRDEGRHRPAHTAARGRVRAAGRPCERGRAGRDRDAVPPRRAASRPRADPRRDRGVAPDRPQLPAGGDRRGRRCSSRRRRPAS